MREWREAKAKAKKETVEKTMVEKMGEMKKHNCEESTKVSEIM